MDEIKKLHEEFLYEFGYNNQTKLINKGELAYNQFDYKHNDKFTYELF
jgi:hypothetical protein